MKESYRVLVRETYSKWIDVNVEDSSLIDQEVQEMEECGEIDWDYTADFDHWDILEYRERELTDSEKEEVRKWALNTVRITRLIDPEWVLEEITETDCRDWLECMRDKGIDIPVLVTSSDLWDAVQKEREKC